MPEGDTIHSVCRVLAPRLLGRDLVGLIVNRQPRPDLAGALLERCEAIGKHLLIGLLTEKGQRLVIRSHLGMKGSWHTYRPHEPWRRHPDRARLVLATAERVFVCFDPKEVAIEGAGEGVAHLGPDLLARAVDLDAIMARARAAIQAERSVGDLLLDQRVASGIGNVYKNEVLFLGRVHPWSPVGALSDATLHDLYRRAAALMRDNLEAGGWRITTYGAGDGLSARARPKEARHWVYRRRGRPCRVCAAMVKSRLQGPLARMAYWCPRCQPPLSAPPTAR